MGLFSSIAGSVAAKMGGEQGRMFQVALEIIERNGGAPGVLQKFRDAGMAEEVDSWLATGENLPLAPSQIEAALGTPVLTDIAQKFHMSLDEVAQTLANYLPKVVDRLSPDGKVPQTQSELMAQAMSAWRRM